MRNPIGDFEHAHERIEALISRLREVVPAAPSQRGSEHARALAEVLAKLRDELLGHFANEEEALFPLVRSGLPSQGPAVDRLEAGHDAICGAVVRLAHLAQGNGHQAGRTFTELYERFVNTYAQHAREEAALLAHLADALDVTRRTELAELLRGL
jgi:iron-sulfur cluster repair protein YtfE (RIC family)